MRTPRRALAAGLAVAAATAVVVGAQTAGGAAPGTPGCSATPSLTRTIPGPTTRVAATTLPGGSVVVSAVGADGNVYAYPVNIDFAKLQVGPLSCFGRPASTPADAPFVLGEGPGGTLWVYAVGTDRHLYERWFGPQYPDGTAWGRSGPDAGAAPDGWVRGGPSRIFHPDTAGALVQSWRPIDFQRISGSAPVGGRLTGSPAVGRTYTATQVVVRAPTGDLYGTSGTATYDEEPVAFSPFRRLAGRSDVSPALAQGYAGFRLDLFAVGNGGLYQSTLPDIGVDPTPDRWTAFRRLGAVPAGTVRVAAAAKPGRVIVLAMTASATYYTQYLGTTGGGWTGWARVPYTWPGGAPDPAAGEKLPALSAG